ncbi:MAG TPA: hypothetical protein PKN33_09790 [Phycisphaerae bacterium]|nr:hypothetical protein [Phycisphaerae bacterium]
MFPQGLAQRLGGVAEAHAPIIDMGMHNKVVERTRIGFDRNDFKRVFVAVGCNGGEIDTNLEATKIESLKRDGFGCRAKNSGSFVESNIAKLLIDLAEFF